MIRWVAVIFIGLLVFSALLPWLEKLGVGRLPGDIRFKMLGMNMCLPFGSTLLWAVAAFLIAKIF